MIPRLSILTLALLAVLGGCTHVPFEPAADRVVEPPPPWLRPRIPVWGLTHHERDEVSRSFRLRTYDDVFGEFRTIDGELWLPEGEGPHPLIAVCPILGGAFLDYIECRVFARAARKRGFASFFLYQDDIILKPSLNATELEQLIRSDVRANLKAIDGLAAAFPIDRSRLGSFGISLGGIRGVILAAAEPRLRANVFCLAGGDFADILRHSAEPLVTRFLDRRQEVALCSREQILADVAANLRSEPLEIARSVDPSRSFLLLARLDRHVPIRNGWRLYEALGRPELRTAPFGHYSSVVVISWALRNSLDFFEKKFGDNPQKASNPPAHGEDESLIPSPGEGAGPQPGRLQSPRAGGPGNPSSSPRLRGAFAAIPAAILTSRPKSEPSGFRAGTTADHTL